MKILPIQALALTLPLAFSAAHGQSQPQLLAVAPIQQLEAAYLRCAEAATNTVMDPGAAVHCGMVADALRDHAFDGSFERLLAWWHVERKRTVASEPRAEDIHRPTAGALR